MKRIPSIKLGQGSIVFLYSFLVFGFWLLLFGF